jgi:glycerophosphoryl diester phosphodiesterase
MASAKAQTAALPPEAQLGPRPLYLVDKMKDGLLKTRLSARTGPFHQTDFSIAHRGAPLQFPEHSKESYLAAARVGAGVIECDVTFTKDRQLVCRHSQCDLHTTTNILSVPARAAKCSQPFSPADPATSKKATAKCCTSDITLAETTLTGKTDGANPDATTAADYQNGTPRWRTDLYANSGALMTPRRIHSADPELWRQVHAGTEGAEGHDAVRRRLHPGDVFGPDVAEYKAAGISPRDVLA